MGALAACLVAAGCGDAVYPVTIGVRLPDGRPAVGCSVIVQREEAPAVIGGGPIGPDGSCAPVVTGRKSPGLPAGTYKVAVAVDAGPPDDRSGRKPLPFAGKFTNLDESGLRIEVGPGQDPAVTVSLGP